ncbi:hypothetical protein ACQZ6F_30300 [Rhizobium sp. A22-96]
MRALFVAVLILIIPMNTVNAADKSLQDILDPYTNSDGHINVQALEDALAKERQKKADAIKKNSSGTAAYLRDSFTDLGFFGEDRFNLSKSKGASVSFTKDRVAHDNELNFKGVLFLSTFSDGSYGGRYTGWSIGPYIGANVDRHSARSKKDSETYIGGVAAELGTDYAGFDQFYRLSTGGVRDVVANTTSLKVKAEFFPVLRREPDNPLSCIGRPCTIPDIDLLYVLTPELFAIYGNSFENHGDAFSGERDDLRLGGQVSLLLQPAFLQKTALSRLYGRITYQWAEEVMSSKPFYNLDFSTWYNLDEDGHIALSASYTRGRDEDTAERLDKLVVGLTGKF